MAPNEENVCELTRLGCHQRKNILLNFIKGKSVQKQLMIPWGGSTNSATRFSDGSKLFHEKLILPGITEIGNVLIAVGILLNRTAAGSWI